MLAGSLVVVSNRLPFTAQTGPHGTRFTRSAGGLVAALEPVLRERGGVWIGWSGVEQDTDGRGPVSSPPPSGRVKFRAVALSAKEVSLYYSGFSNRTLWPLFHYFVSRTHIDGTTWRAYDAVNERFARAAVEDSTDQDLVWVHDYQLLRVPLHLRHLAPGRRIAFFLHIPFPAYDVFRVLPWCRQLVRGLLAADLVGFHVGSYAHHFMTCAERLLGCDVDHSAGLVHFEGREVSVQAHPIGIDAERVEEFARRAQPPPGGAGAGAGTGADAEGVARIIGLDRLDYTKGIDERLLALERLFERYPRFRGRVVFTQVLVPSREQVAEYRDLKRGLDETVGRINGRFSDHGWSPIRYLVRSLRPEELGAFYRDADVALVTPLRDGMNLVAKEYVACQVDEPGVLVLSELAGAAEELQEALLVNPFDVDAVAETLHRALTMPADERQARMSALRHRVRENSVHAWVSRFLEAAAASTSRPRGTVTAVDRVRQRLEPWLAGRPGVALFFDYDGTLTPIERHPDAALLPPAAREALEAAARAPRLDMVIVSGRALEDLKRRVGIAGLTYVGNHGFEIEGPGVAFRHRELDQHTDKVAQAARELEALAAPGALVEPKGATLSYHVREVAPEQRARVERHAETILRRLGLRATRGLEVIEGRPPVEWHKGHAVLYVLVQRHGADWPSRVRAVYLGDDATDEDAFRSLRGIGRSIRVGPTGLAATSFADYALPDPDAVVQLVRWLAAEAFAAKV